ncbi:ABC transporter ATP-binding protein [Flavipsychrobacter stenotrophus]|uniref:ABC transporter ATP-binding protein n=1 Tax=Flavipsychrobacter stenotrophus TaxID=2077091 RepID=A0A2S7T0K2_9BACT|nr:ABC transporter ATP-binding protein [Flavipsychrobacter stenotrophus]PQJ12484.1 ABC transporter ATP-binding protein [Flavipsychrobacter stenotrophus]
MKLLMSYLSRYKGMIVLAILLAAVNQSFSLMDPMIAGKLLDRYVNHPLTVDKEGHISRDLSTYMSGALLLIAALIGVAMVSRIAKNFQDYVVNVVIQKFGAQLYTDGLRHALRLPYQEFEDQSSGQTLSVLQKVRVDCEKFITSFFGVLLPTIIGLVFVIVYAFALSPLLPLVYVGGAIVLGLLTSALSKKIKVVQKTIVKETNALAGSTTESLRNIELVKSLGLTQQEIRRLNSTTIKILKLELKKVRSIRTISFIQGTFVNLLRQAIVMSLLFFIYKGTISPGQYLTLIFYSFFIFGPMQEIGSVIMTYREAEASLNNIQELFKKPMEYTPEQPEAINEIQEVKFDNVTFKHNSSSRPALDGISFDVKLGETIAFVGPSGSGKTTLVKLLVGLYHPNNGHIYYNGHTDKNIDYEELRHQMGLVTQDPQLFSGTIKENLLFVNPSASEADINEALTNASCQNLLSRAENGLDTLIGEGGLKLSGGERQRISIARSLLRKPRLMIFDEATSALDSLTEDEISQTIKGITSQRQHITIMIAHRLSTIMHADRIYVLEKGNVIETGNHESLVAEKGLYYAMWRQQIGERKELPKMAKA